MIAPQSSQETLNFVKGQIDHGKYKAARDQAAIFSEKVNEPLRGEFAFAAARACAYLGDIEGVIHFLDIAVTNLKLSPDVPMSEPAFQGIVTDIRFVQIVTKNSPHSPDEAGQHKESDKSHGIEVNAGNDTQIKMNDQSTEVRAGDVSVHLGK